MIYRLADNIRVQDADGGGVLLASRPLRLARLNSSLLALVRRVHNDWYAAQTSAEAAALENLVKNGFVRCKRLLSPHLQQLPLVSVVIPVKDRAEELRQCLTSLSKLDYPRERLEIVVVDDGSSDETPATAKELGAILIASGAVGGGPALARNQGARVASGEILAFIDSDCIASAHWLQELLPVFAEEQVAAVGGLVDGMYTDSALDRYEAAMSSLNLGGREMSGSVGNDTFYLPSCNLLVRREAFLAAGGFRTALHVGEDVDLTWRLRDAGWKIVYLPEGAVQHAHRSRLWPFMKRRFDYGTSEGMLKQLHPVRGKKMALPPVLAVILGLLTGAVLGLSLLPLPLAAAVLLADALLVNRRLRKQQLPFTFGDILLARARAVGSLGYYLGYHLLRYYLGLLLLAACIYPPLGLVLLLTFAGVGRVDYSVRRPHMMLPAFYLYYLCEQLSYGAGVFWGCFRLGSFSSYRLSFREAQAA
ncbi:MAG: mycofactocin biosynthesis glycosyltransferase MftF [Desulfuromonadales bacterium]